MRAFLFQVGGAVGVVLGLGPPLIPIDIPFLPASRVSPGLSQALWSMVLPMVVGLLGGGLPALRAARLPLIEALRAG